MGIIFVRYGKHMHLFRNLLLIYLVWAAYDSHLCAFSSMFVHSVTNYFWKTKALCVMP